MADAMRLMMRYNQLWRGPEELEKAHEVLAEDFVRSGTSGSFRGIPAFQRYVRHFSAAFPDARFTPEDWVADGDKLAVRYRFTATHRGDFLGIPPTGQAIRADGAAIYVIKDGRLRELWDFLDMLRLVSGSLPYPVREEI